MRYQRLVLMGLLALAAVAAAGVLLMPWPGARAAADSDGDGLPDPVDPGNPQAGEDQCPLLAEDADGVDDLDGCPDTDIYVSAAMDEAYVVSAGSVETRTVEISIQNGNYPTDILVHALSVSTVGACEVSLIPAPEDESAVFITDEDGDTIADTRSLLLEWELSLDAGESHDTTRDYEVICSQLGEDSFEIQVDAVPWPPVEEEDVEDLPNVQKSFPLVTVVADTGLDSDGDGFGDEVEGFVGTNPMVACASTGVASDEEPDAWPADFDDNQIVNITDVFNVLPPVFGSSVADPAYVNRVDLQPDGVINITDVFKVLPPVFGSSCTP